MTAQERIRIERFSDRHAEGMAALYGDPAVARQVLQLPYQSAEQWRRRLAPENEHLMVLVALHQERVIGSATLEHFSRIRRSHCGAIGLGVAPDWQGRGVGSQLLGEVLKVADDFMNLRRIELTVYIDNHAAIALYRKFGFVVEGELRDYAIRDGGFVDVLSMARLRP